MDEVVGVCFKPTGKVYYFSAAGLKLRPGDLVVAETSRGQELAEVVSVAPYTDRLQGKLKPILRQATESDIVRGQENRRREEEARRVCQRALRQMDCVVKLVDVEYAFDGSRITFSFASDDKMDFRELQRRLKSIYDCEIEIRQIGVRDQAKILGGLGPCGRPLCCAAFLRSFQPVTIRMAKDQQLALNPAKISGQCGRLMCCLRYEHDQYQEAREAAPAGESAEETAEPPKEASAYSRDEAILAPAETQPEAGAEVASEPGPSDTGQVFEPRPTAAQPTEQPGTTEPKRRRRRRSHRRPPAPAPAPISAAEPSWRVPEQSAPVRAGESGASRPRARRRRRHPRT